MFQPKAAKERTQRLSESTTGFESLRRKTVARKTTYDIALGEAESIEIEAEKKKNSRGENMRKRNFILQQRAKRKKQPWLTRI